MMLSALLKPRPPLEEESVLWMIDTFAWASTYLAAGWLRDQAALVLPTNEFFPGRASSTLDMADLIFARVVAYGGMTDWPLRLAGLGTCPAPVPGLTQAAAPAVNAGAGAFGTGHIPVGYDPALVSNPEALISNFALTLAGIRSADAGEPPPGGEQARPQATEILAVAMGFGVMLANSARTVQVRSCGSCGPAANRQSFLSRFDITYALALFCALKDIGTRSVTPHLNKPLRPFFRKALRDVAGRPDDLSALKQLF